MTEAAFIAGDWGTSRLRLYLCSASGESLDHAEGPGAADTKGNFAAVFSSLTASWRRQDDLPAVLCGMVGSSIGWKAVAAGKCPVAPDAIAQSVAGIPEQNVFIVPGLGCRNALNAPDFMRGEETQLLGALQLRASMRQGRQLVCLPGTHTKWVMLDNGTVEHFMTVPAGELFALLCKYSVLVHDVPPPAVPIAAVNPAFLQGMEEIIRGANAGMLCRLFECRSRRLSGELSTSDSPSFLSGLLVASDVRDALALFAEQLAGNEVLVIGTGGLCNLYTHVLTAMDCLATTLSGEDAVRAGLAHVYRLLRAGNRL